METEPAVRPTPKILVVEDEPDIAALVAYHLTREGFRVETANTGPDALSAASQGIPDLLILDLMLPGMSGYEVLESLRGREATATIPVLILTAKKQPEDRIQGFELGADDYLTKPFSPRELVLRVQAILRRIREVPTAAGGQVLKLGGLTLDAASHEVALDGEPLSLTPTEFRLLLTLLEHPGHTQSRKQLLERVWDVEARVSNRIHTRTVDMHVRRLRSKLAHAGDWIETVRGFGYRMRGPVDME